MINEDKTKQIARNIAYNLGNKVCDDIKTYGYEDVYNAALQALQSKDEQHAKEKQQWIEKACEAFCKCECCANCGEHKTNCTILGDFKKAMEEKKNTPMGVSKFCYDYHGNPIINNLL